MCAFVGSSWKRLGQYQADIVTLMSFRDAALSFQMIEGPGSGRQFTARRRVRLGDATPNGRLRLDAVARYLQDVSNDDTRDADWSDPHWWVVRRTVIDVHQFPEYMKEIDLTTWCGGIGSHWAERRTRISAVDGTPLIDAASLWVHVDEATMQPSKVPADVVDILAASAGGRDVNARLLLRDKLFDASTTHTETWPLRFADFDAVGHMNNAAYWVIVEEFLAANRDVRAPLRAVVEHVVQVEPGQEPIRHIASGRDDLELQLRVGSTMHAAMWCGLNP
jgi:acyl-ACP thioesterase